MGFLTGLFQKRATAGGTFHVSQTPPGWIESMSGYEVASGATVNETSALSLATVYACIRVLAEGVAALPLHLYRRLSPAGKERATDHRLYELLHDAPNDEMTSMTFRETLMGHLCGWGNAYAELELDGAGRVTALWPLRPDRMSVARVAGELVYNQVFDRPDELGRTSRTLAAERVLHVKGLGFDGLTGYSPIRLAKQAIGLAMAAEEFGARFFGNDARPGMVLTHPAKLTDEAYKRLKDSWESRHMGLERSHRVAVLEEGLTIKEIGIPPEDAQFLSTREFQVAEICRFFRVPPHLVQDLTRSTFSNIEHQGIDFVTYSLTPWLVRWEQEIWLRVLMPAERKGLFAEHLVNGLLRGDAASRFAAYNIGRNGGWLSANDVREMENMNPIDGGDVYLIPMNMVPAGQGTSEEKAEEEEGRGAADGRSHAERGNEARVRERRAAEARRHRLMGTWRRVYADAAGRIVRREASDLTAEARRLGKAGGESAAGEFVLFLDSFYAADGEQFGYTAKTARPVAWSYGEEVAACVEEELGTRSVREHVPPQSDGTRSLAGELEPWVQRYVETFASRHSVASRERMRQVVARALDDRVNWWEAVEEEAEHWRQARPDDVAMEESVRFNNALAVHMFGLAGVTSLYWRAFGESCPYCSALDGRKVGINQSFLQEGEDFQPEGAEAPMHVYQSTRHAPAHTGCDCMVTAG